MHTHVITPFWKDLINMKQYKVGIVGATGMVGQRFSLLLSQHLRATRARPMPRLVKAAGR